MLRESQATHDLELVAGVLQLADGEEEERAQKIQSRLLIVKGEWFADTELGLDYHGVVWVKGTPVPVVLAHVQRVALAAAGDGSQIESADVTQNTTTRTASVSLSVRLPTGETVTVETQ